MDPPPYTIARMLPNPGTALRAMRIGPALFWQRIRERLFPREFPCFARELHERYYAGRPAHAMDATWKEFALSSYPRGQRVAALVRCYRRIAGARCLDIGTAYGGFPIAFSRAGAGEAIGIEMDGKLLKVASALQQDIPSSARLIPGDAMDEAFLRELGRFDIITCNDVIEHVDDARRLIKHLGLLMAPGALVYLEVPNYQSARYVLRDGHFGLLGITLLRRPEAMEYCARFFAGDYTVGEYYPLERYRRWFEEEGVRIECVPDLLSPRRRMAELRGQLEELERTHPERIAALPVSEWIRARLGRAIADYLQESRAAVAELDRLRGAQKRQSEERVVSRYGTEMWQIVGREMACPGGG